MSQLTQHLQIARDGLASKAREPGHYYRMGRVNGLRFAIERARGDLAKLTEERARVKTLILVTRQGFKKDYWIGYESALALAIRTVKEETNG